MERNLTPKSEKHHLNRKSTNNGQSKTYQPAQVAKLSNLKAFQNYFDKNLF
jgi:hypothetical protein